MDSIAVDRYIHCCGYSHHCWQLRWFIVDDQSIHLQDTVPPMRCLTPYGRDHLMHCGYCAPQALPTLSQWFRVQMPTTNENAELSFDLVAVSLKVSYMTKASRITSHVHAFGDFRP